MFRRITPFTLPNGTVITSEFVADPDAPCQICETSKLPTRVCCGLSLGNYRIKPPKLVTKPARGHFNEGCYLKATRDCSRKLSREHYMSQAILRLFGDKFVATGFPWIPKGETRILPVDAMGANVLCTHHNSTLGQLDGPATRFFSALYQIHLEAHRDPNPDEVSGSWHSGEAVEQWLVKLALGQFYSKNASQNGVPLLSNHNINLELAQNALLHGRFERACGLYIKGSGNPLPSMEAYGLGPLTFAEQKLFTGCILYISGLEFVMNFDPVGVDQQEFESLGYSHRPSELVFRLPGRTRILKLTWEPGTPPRSLTFDPGPLYAPKSL